MIENEDLVFNLLGLHEGLLLFLLLGLLGLTQFFSRRLWQSFYHTLQQLEIFELGKTNAPHFEQTKTAEFERLNTVLRNLIEKRVVLKK